MVFQGCGAKCIEYSTYFRIGYATQQLIIERTIINLCFDRSLSGFEQGRKFRNLIGPRILRHGDSITLKELRKGLSVASFRPNDVGEGTYIAKGIQDTVVGCPRLILILNGTIQGFHFGGTQGLGGRCGADGGQKTTITSFSVSARLGLGRRPSECDGCRDQHDFNFR